MKLRLASVLFLLALVTTSCDESDIKGLIATDGEFTIDKYYDVNIPAGGETEIVKNETAENSVDGFRATAIDLSDFYFLIEDVNASDDATVDISIVWEGLETHPFELLDVNLVSNQNLLLDFTEMASDNLEALEKYMVGKTTLRYTLTITCSTTPVQFASYFYVKGKVTLQPE